MAQQTKTLSQELGVTVLNIFQYHDGISITVNTKKDAYVVAYSYQHAKETRIEYAPNIQKWVVQIYS